jgi:hypothetical protein
MICHLRFVICNLSQAIGRIPGIGYYAGSQQVAVVVECVALRLNLG